MNSRLLDILKTRFNIAEEILAEAVEAGEANDKKTGDILVRKKIVSRQDLLEATGVMFDLPVMDKLQYDNIDTSFTREFPIQYLKRHLMVPLRPPADETDEVQPECIIALNDPVDFHAADDLVNFMDINNYRFVLASKDEILSAVNSAYDKSRDSAEQLVENMEEQSGAEILNEIEGTADLLDDTNDAPIIKLVNHIISQSIKANASDIHIEPFHNSFKIRYRVDGIMYDLLTPPKWLQNALVSRIKVMAKLNIAEKRLPQDGRIEVKIGHQDIDIRVSTIPVSFGERVVLRLLNKSASLMKLDDFGMSDETYRTLKELINIPNGVILVTGPTGSGKTTTLYAILTALNNPDINIITIEDPVEYQLNGIGQIQVNPKIDLTFAKGLRSIVRQDPDIILIGEIRDRETAEIAIQSALTGHLVFSTLHTNDSASAVTRLVDIGIEPFLITSAVKAVVAQRLIRVLCSECKTEYVPDEVELKSIGISPEAKNAHTFYTAKGCPKCFNTGYRGRMSIYEIMVLGRDIKGLILETSDSNVIKSKAVKKGMTTLRMDGISKVLAGQTTIEEILRVTQK